MRESGGIQKRRRSLPEPRGDFYAAVLGVEVDKFCYFDGRLTFAAVGDKDNACHVLGIGLQLEEPEHGETLVGVPALCILEDLAGVLDDLGYTALSFLG